MNGQRGNEGVLDISGRQNAALEHETEKEQSASGSFHRVIHSSGNLGANYSVAGEKQEPEYLAHRKFPIAASRASCLTPRVFSVRTNSALASSLVFATMLWGANNAGMKHLVKFWPPLTISSVRFLLCGVVMLALLRGTNWLGPRSNISPGARRQLWTRTGLTLAVYVAAFMFAIKHTTPANVALYLGASPVWALLLEGRTEKGRGVRWLAAGLAVAGAAILFWPALSLRGDRWIGEVCAILGSVLWALYGHLSRGLSGSMTGAELTAQSMWRAGLLLVPFTLWELSTATVVWRWDAAGIFAYSVLLPGIVSFALWAHALKLWPTSKVYLFNNLIPMWTVFWAWLFFGDPVTPNVWLALILIVGAVGISQANWEKILGRRWLPPE